MPLLPSRGLVLYTDLPATRVAEIFASSVTPRRFFRWESTSCPFEGVVTGFEFDFQPIARHAGRRRDSFLPQIRGTISPRDNGSRIIVTMRLRRTVILLLPLSGSGLILVAFATAEGALAGVEVVAPALIALGFLLFGYFALRASFTFHANRAEALLASLVQAERREE